MPRWRPSLFRTWLSKSFLSPQSRKGSLYTAWYYHYIIFSPVTYGSVAYRISGSLTLTLYDGWNWTMLWIRIRIRRICTFWAYGSVIFFVQILLFCDFFFTLFLWKLMWLCIQKIISKNFEKILSFSWDLVSHWRKKQDPDSSSLTCLRFIVLIQTKQHLVR